MYKSNSYNKERNPETPKLVSLPPNIFSISRLLYMNTDNQGDKVNESLQELLGRCGAGEDDAIRELIRIFRPRALELAASLLEDRDLAEDAVQEAFLTALSELPKLREPEAFSAWFRQIVRTRCNRIIRRRKELPIDDVEEQLHSADSPAKHLELEELCSKVREAMRNLPSAERETVEMFYFDQRNCASIASLLQCPGGTIRRRLHDARKRLRGMLLGYIGDAVPEKKDKKSNLPL